MGFSVWMYGLSRPKSMFLPLSRYFCITSWFDDDVTRITSIVGMGIWVKVRGLGWDSVKMSEWQYV